MKVFHRKIDQNIWQLIQIKFHIFQIYAIKMTQIFHTDTLSECKVCAHKHIHTQIDSHKYDPKFICIHFHFITVLYFGFDLLHVEHKHHVPHSTNTQHTHTRVHIYAHNHMYTVTFINTHTENKNTIISNISGIQQ